VYDKWCNNPRLKVPTNNQYNQSFRSSHNARYTQRSEQLTDNVLASHLLTDKTYYSSLKDHIFKIPIVKVYKKDRVMTQTAS